MTAVLPDVSLLEASAYPSPLEWVGMQDIDLPVTIAEAGYLRELHARVDVQVDLPAPHVKGIHMSRLYRLLNTLDQGHAVTPSSLRHLLQAMIDSHRDCDTRSARIRVNLDLLIRRPALVTQGLSGWKSYPVRLEACLVEDKFNCRVKIVVDYSSTCPCSAALARQIVEQGFMQTYGHRAALTPAEVATWLHANASLATPHSQRSEAHVSVDRSASDSLGLLALIDCVEQAVGTPVQSAVKRADEQAFAALNGQNLMFVEDAARRIEANLSQYRQARVYVRHMESLHPHDAVAWTTSLNDRGGA